MRRYNIHILNHNIICKIQFLINLFYCNISNHIIYPILLHSILIFPRNYLLNIFFFKWILMINLKFMANK